MKTYALYIDENNIKFPSKDKGNSFNYYMQEENLLKDGYLEFIDNPYPNDGKTYQKKYEVVDDKILASYVELVQSLDSIKDKKILEINNIYEDKANLVTFGTPPSEVKSWTNQQSDWEAWKKDKKASTPFVDALVRERYPNLDFSEQKEILMDKIGVKVTAYIQYIGSLTGKRQYYEDMIIAATTPEDLESISWV